MVAFAQTQRTRAMKAYTRAKKIKSIQFLVAMNNHAWRKDRVSQDRVRPDAEPGTNLSWTIEDSPKPSFDGNSPPNYLAAYKAWKAENGVGERKGAQLGLHLLVGVSTEWVQETGDLHDPANPRNVQLLQAAIEWGNTWSKGGVYGARLDLDETGGAVVDLFVAPVREQRHKNGKSKPVVSVNKALEELSEEFFESKTQHYAALNSSWAKYAHEHLDTRLQRGVSKSQTGREHIAPDSFRAMMEAAETHNAAAAADREAAAADRKTAERLRKEAEDLKRKEQQRIEEEVRRVAELTVRAIAGVADGSSYKNAGGKWQLTSITPQEYQFLRPFAPIIVSGMEAVNNVVSGARNLFEKLTGLFKAQAEEEAKAETRVGSIFTRPAFEEMQEDVSALDLRPVVEEEHLPVDDKSYEPEAPSM